jgi:hypothetical protein
MIRKWVKNLPGINRIVQQRDLAIKERDRLSEQVHLLQNETQRLSGLLAAASTMSPAPVRRQYVEPGHFFSPIPSDEDIQAYKRDFPRRLTQPLAAINLNIQDQLKLLEIFGSFYSEMPFPENPPAYNRYFLNNNAFNYMDGLVLYSMLRHLHPAKMIEIGCGYSSCATLDTNELFLSNRMKCSFIEPYPQLFYSLVKKSDLDRVQIIPSRLQDVDPALFSELNENDILFIDSTHVSRLNSDVNLIFFEILPLLKPGVIVHIHDIYFPFEYPIEWHDEGRVWTESYITRAFLEFNPDFKIIFWSSYLNRFFQDKIVQHLPLGIKNAGGSLWLKKVL